MKTITLCGSMKVLDSMKQISHELASLGWSVYMPSFDEPVDYQTVSAERRAVLKSGLIRSHFDHIARSDCILVVNNTVGDKRNYIGANAFLEMGYAFGVGKPIYLLNALPDQANTDELAGLLPVIVHGDLSRIGA